MLVSVPGAATPLPGSAQAVPERAGGDRILVQASAGEPQPGCPTSIPAASLDTGSDARWTRENLRHWNEATFRAVTARALEAARAALSGPGVTICAGLAGRPVQPTLERMRGIGGAAFPGGRIAVFVAPAINPAWARELPAVIAHEYHHVAAPVRATNGLEVLIREGRAQYFAARQHPGMNRPAAAAVAAAELPAIWASMRAGIRGDPQTFLREYMFGGPYFGDRVPVWAGYTIAYCLVRAFAAGHPDLTQEELSRVPPEAFIAPRVVGELDRCGAG